MLLYARSSTALPTGTRYGFSIFCEVKIYKPPSVVPELKEKEWATTESSTPQFFRDGGTSHRKRSETHENASSLPARRWQSPCALPGDNTFRKGRTVREFLDKEVDFEAIKRILEAGNLAPTWNHNRNWSYIILRTDEEKEFAFEYAKKIADKFDAEKYLNTPRPYPTTLAQKMYGYAMPRQYTMLKDASYVVIPVFKCKELNGKYVSKLNPFSTIWCVIENIFLAATAEGLGCSMRIPLNEEHDIVKAKLKVPPTYMIPVFIGIGYADPNETVLEQNVADLDRQLHYGRWK